MANFATSMLAGFVVFSFLGFMAGTMKTTVDKVVEDGKWVLFCVAW